jgi:hypothetical protein
MGASFKSCLTRICIGAVCGWSPHHRHQMGLGVWGLKLPSVKELGGEKTFTSSYRSWDKACNLKELPKSKLSRPI